MSPIVFLSIFLGLVSGQCLVELQVDPAVHSVRVLAGAETLATIARPPWRATVDFGPGLVPRRLSAVAYDARGNELGRVSQTVNLPRAIAEVQLSTRTDAGRHTIAEVHWSHRLHAKPEKVSVSLDGKALRVDSRQQVTLPVMKSSIPHVLSAEVRFPGKVIARSETVIDGESGYSDSASSELSPIVVSGSVDLDEECLAHCFRSGGREVRVSASEKTGALLTIVRDPDPQEVIEHFRAEEHNVALWEESRSAMNKMALERGTTTRLMWVVASRYEEQGKLTVDAFDQSSDIGAGRGGMLWLLTRAPSRFGRGAPRYADAVATAGVAEAAEGVRRAVVLLLPSAKTYEDASRFTPQQARRYLARIGVPLAVWSLNGPRPDLADSWGTVDDVSTEAGLAAATTRLRETLAEQTVVWLAVDALSALDVEVAEVCGLKSIATH